MIDVARGKKTLIEVASALDNEKRENLSPLAPPQGLVLERIYYPEKMEKFLY
jgi:tRNA U38,U39,U40 pseudouridine synthase TruA